MGRAYPPSVAIRGSGAAGSAKGEEGRLGKAPSVATPGARWAGRALCWRGRRPGALSTGRCVA